MGKNWLIRTKSNHILGPISKEKVLELYQNGSIKPDDEICSGNGYWFFIRESELVEKYLVGKETQTFNPISEAKDVLTSLDANPQSAQAREHITRVGALSLSTIQNGDEKTVQATVDVSRKKKLKSNSLQNYSGAVKKPEKQFWFLPLGVLVFIILFSIIYYRKSILRTFFEAYASLPKFDSLLISKASAQDEVPGKKKKLLASEILVEDVTFRPLVGLDGFRVVSAFSVDQFTCAKLESPTFQLGIILYPPELINEKFLISLRNCMVKLGETHPVKKWLKLQSTPVTPDPKEQQKVDFLREILNSQFNLITDQNVKNKVIQLLAEIPKDTNLEKLLKSYLYLMIGNLTRSDRNLKSIISQTPRDFFKGYSVKASVYHQLTATHVERVLRKFSRHPADRLTFFLLTKYLKSFTNKPELLELVDDLDSGELNSKLRLSYLERIQPNLLGHLRLARMDENRRIKTLRSRIYTPEMQALWVWPFMEVGPLASEVMVAEVKKLDKTDPLWAIYLLDDEKLADLYVTKGGVSIARRRTFLRQRLTQSDDYMLALYKLIEIGDIDEELVSNVSLFLKHE